MKQMKRMLALLLAFVMIVGVLPLSVFADEYGTANGEFNGGTSTVVDAFVVFSDLHVGTNNTNNTNKQQLVNNVMTAIKNDGKPVSSVASSGDMFSSNESTMAGNASTVTGYVQQVFNVPVNYVWTDHDRAATDISKESRLVYSGNYYVYLLSMADLATFERYVKFYTEDEVNAHIEAFKTTVAGLDKSKPLFIVGHQPLYNRRGDNAYALKWVNAINEVAEDMDVAYFHGHNHNYDKAEDYYYAKGSEMPVPTSKGDGYNPAPTEVKVKLNFTHVNAGYMDPGSSYTKNARLGTAMVVTIYNDKINFTAYDKNGEYTGNFAVNKDVSRKVEVPKSLAVTGKIDYAVGDAIVAPSEVKVTYVNGETKALTEGYKLSKITKGNTEYTVDGFAFPEEGTYTLIYTCTLGNYQAQAALTVTVVGADSETEEPSSNKVTVAGTTYEEKTVYVLVDAPVDGGKYLIVNQSLTNGDLSKDWDVDDDGMAVIRDGDEITYAYAVPTAGTVTGVNGVSYTNGYIELDNANAVWTATQSANRNGLGWILSNGDKYLTTSGTDSVEAGDNKFVWNYVADGDDSYLHNGDKYLYFTYYDNNKDEWRWRTGEYNGISSTRDIFFYQEMTVMVPVEGTVTYTMSASDVTCQLSDTNQVQLTYGLLADGAAVAELPEGGSYSFSIFDDVDGIISAISADGTITFNNVVGQCRVKVAYTWGEYTVYQYVTVQTTAAQIPEVELEDESVGVTVKAPGLSSLVVGVVNDPVIMEAVSKVLIGNVVAYDIKVDGFESGVATVTLPIPEGVENPEVYYVSDDGKTVERMYATKNADGTVTFTTTHFSTYVVGESTEITVPDPEEATGRGEVTTTVEKEVYVLVSTPTAGKQYIIVSRNSAGSGHALKENTTTGSSITVKAAGNGISAPYIETTDETIMWNATSGLKFQSENGGYYLRYNNGLTFSTINSTNWTYSNSRLYYDGNYNYYLRYNRGWSTSTTQNNVYLYEKQTVEVETTTTVSGTYSIAGTPAEVIKVVENGTTATLGSTVIFTPDDGAAYEVENPDVTYEVYGDPNDIISGDISGNTVTFTGNYGKALVKVSYNSSFGEVTNYIVVTASAPYYTIQLHKNNGDALGDMIADGEIIAIKGVEAGDTYSVWAVVKKYDGVIGNGETEDGVDLGALGSALTWSVSDTSIATIDTTTGVITFTGKDGTIEVMVEYTGDDGKTIFDTITISATASQYNVPADGTSDFPEYPNEGAIRFDKTATAVGNFSETGIAQIELSMTGVPYTTGNRMDVVLMLDRSSSMYKSGVQHRISSTVEAAKAFVTSIVKNEDGTFNNNRILVLDFLGGNLDSSEGGGSKHVFESNQYTSEEENGYQVIENQAELDALLDKIEDEFVGQTSLYGTEYAQGLKLCYDALAASKADGNQQFCVFMSDGIPNYMMGEETHFKKTDDIVATFDVTNRTSANGKATRGDNYEYEYYSTEMKNMGVTVFSVGLGLKNTNSAWSGTSKEVCEQVANMLLNDISGPAGETAAQRDTGNAVSKLDEYFFSVADENAAEDMKNVFSAIAQKILQAATDVTVEDKITDEYTMIFDIPTGSNTISGVTKDFYIEFLKYTLDATTHERVDSDKDGNTYEEATSVTKLYLQNNDGELSASNAAEPKFEQKVIGDKGTLLYWTTNTTYAAKAAVSCPSNGTTYYFIPYGMEVNENGTIPAGWYNMTSGAYAHGTVDSTNMSQDLVIATPYFVYNAGTRMLYWTVDKIDTAEYALRYFLYLENSATEVGTAKETDPGSYQTNEYAHLTYTNFQGNDCRQEFPVPQLTWSGAQVSYVFYLVNAQGQPINQAGQVVDFANAVFVTKVYTESTVWNKGADGKITADSQLSIDWLANELLPSDYKVYDEEAQYQLHVYGDHTGESIFDYFIIGGGEADDIAASLSTRLGQTISSAAVDTTKVYNTRAGEEITGYGTYTSKATDEYNDEIVLNGFDFYNTTVAFAVVWQPALAQDTVVVDFGLDVLINVTQNDLITDNKINGIGKDITVFGNTVMNSGAYRDAKLGKDNVIIDRNTISIENDTQIRFHQGDMVFDKAVVFYYESSVKYYQNSTEYSGYLYSKVTVIPATTIYYEDSFISNNDLKTYEWDLATNDWKAPTTGIGTGDFDWKRDGMAGNATQAQDRPGATMISGVLDADNNYGYDAAYSSMSQYSMGAALKVHVDYDHMATASFNFWGTGFDVISLTSSTTGTIIVNVYDSSDVQVKSFVVNTYYGFTYDGENWVPTDPTNPNALYQVPVMKISELPYGQYRAEIKAVYDPIFDQGLYDNASYDFYLDAIRIYDPTGNEDKTSNDAYLADGEAWPEYTELRNMVLDAEKAQSDDKLEGVVFIDGANTDPDGKVSVSDYTSYGPNNELYLAKNQSIAFYLNATANEGKVAGIQLGIKSVGGAGHVVITAGGKTYIDMDVATATDMYYDLDVEDFNGKTVTITSTGDAIISLTNVKVTYTAAQKSDSAEEKSYLLSVNASSILSALLTLKGKDPIVMPNVPAEPELPVLPEQPGKPVQPIKPGKPVQPGKPIKPVKPVQPVQPVLPGKPVQPNKPVMPGKPVRPGSNLAVALY